MRAAEQSRVIITRQKICRDDLSSGMFCQYRPPDTETFNTYSQTYSALIRRLTFILEDY